METNEPHEWEGLSQVCGGSIGCRTGLKTLCLWWVLIQSQGLILNTFTKWFITEYLYITWFDNSNWLYLVQATNFFFHKMTHSLTILQIARNTIVHIPVLVNVIEWLLFQMTASYPWLWTLWTSVRLVWVFPGI